MNKRKLHQSLYEPCGGGSEEGGGGKGFKQARSVSKSALIDPLVSAFEGGHGILEIKLRTWTYNLVVQ